MFSTDEISGTLVSSAIYDGWSMFAIFVAVLYMIEVLETETLQSDLMQELSDSSESIAVYFYGCLHQVEQQLTFSCVHKF